MRACSPRSSAGTLHARSDPRSLRPTRIRIRIRTASASAPHPPRVDVENAGADAPGACAHGDQGGDTPGFSCIFDTGRGGGNGPGRIRRDDSRGRAARRELADINTVAAPYRHPVVLAKELPSLDALPRGRILLRAGLGWMAEEFASPGMPRTKSA